MPFHIFYSSHCARCIFEREPSEKANLSIVKPSPKIDCRSAPNDPQVETPGTLSAKAHSYFHHHISPLSIHKPHSLTCPLRSIRARPIIAPTRFKPPLFLKSGPLLRYCGLRRDRPKVRSGRQPTQPERNLEGKRHDCYSRRTLEL